MASTMLSDSVRTKPGPGAMPKRQIQLGPSTSALAPRNGISASVPSVDIVGLLFALTEKNRKISLAYKTFVRH